MREQALASLQALVEVVEKLRAPGGCPWDREQTHRTLRPYLLEESYELLEAIETGDSALLREELGDLLLQVLMHSVIAEEEDAEFDIGSVAEVTRAKMVHRHPHVFGDVTVSGAADVVVNWERLKRTEKRARLSVLDGVPNALPALAHAQGVQRRPARLGFDETPTVQAALDRLRETLSATEALAAKAPDQVPTGQDWTISEGEIRRDSEAAGSTSVVPAPEDLEDTVGNLLFAAVALARRLRVNPEDALRRRSSAFAQRFRLLEERARDEGVDLHALDVGEWRRRWRDAESQP
jgi:MazG family protein